MITNDEMTKRNLSPMMQGDDKGTFIRFFYGAVQNATRSLQKGSPQFDEHEFIQFNFAGNTQTVHEKQVDEAVKDRFSRQYEMWKKNSTEIANGTDLNALPFLNSAVIEQMKRLNILTVEALSTLSDAGCQTLGMGATQFKNQATEWLASKKDDSAYPKVVSENEDLKKEIAMLKTQIVELNSLLETARSGADIGEADELFAKAKKKAA